MNYKIEVRNTGDKNDLLRQILNGIKNSTDAETASVVEAAFQTEDNQKQLQRMQDRLDNPPDSE